MTNVSFTNAVAKLEREARERAEAAAYVRRFGEADFRPGLHDDIREAMKALGRAKVYPTPGKELGSRPTDDVGDDASWKAEAIRLAGQRKSDFHIAMKLGVPQQAVRNVLSRHRKSRFRAKVAAERAAP